MRKDLVTILVPHVEKVVDLLWVLLVTAQRGHHTIVYTFLDSTSAILDPWYVRHDLLRKAESLDANHRW